MKKPFQNFDINVKILTWQGFLIGLSFWSPVAAIYFAKVTGSYTLGLSIFSVAMLSSVIFEIPTGIFSDLIGRKWTNSLAGLAYTISIILYALGINYWFLIAGAICEGFARALYSGNDDALLYDSLAKSNKKDQLAKFMGFIGSAEQWALGITALLGGIIAAIFSLKLIIWLSVIPLFSSFLSSLFLKEAPNQTKGEGNIFLHLKKSIVFFIKNKKLRLLSLSEAVGYGLGESAFQFTPVFVEKLWPLWAIGLARTLANIGAALGFGLSGKIIKKYKAINILLFEQIVSKVVNLFSFIFPSPVSPVLLSSTSLLYGPSTVAQNTLLQTEFSDGQRSTMGSINSLAKGLFYSLALLWMGWLADLTNPVTALIFGQLVGLTSVWLTWKLYKLSKN